MYNSNSSSVVLKKKQCNSLKKKGIYGYDIITCDGNYIEVKGWVKDLTCLKFGEYQYYPV